MGVQYIILENQIANQTGYQRIMIFLSCPPVYTLPGTWNDPEKIAKCNAYFDTSLYNADPNITFGISLLQ